MKRVVTVILVVMCIAYTSCSTGKGCPASGRNVGAERILSGDAKTMKEVKKARKFKS